MRSRRQVVGEAVNEDLLHTVGGGALIEEPAEEIIELGGVLIGEDDLAGADAVLQGVLGDAGLGLVGLGAGPAGLDGGGGRGGRRGRGGLGDGVHGGSSWCVMGGTIHEEWGIMR